MKVLTLFKFSSFKQPQMDSGYHGRRYRPNVQNIPEKKESACIQAVKQEQACITKEQKAK